MLYNSVSFAEEPEKIEKVVVTGMGVDADKARQNAIRNAVEQVIGAYVSSDTMVQDSQLIKDEILSYSGGYVKESRVISTEKSDDGLFSIKLEALVVATKLKRKIQALNIATKKVEGESLFGEAFSKIEEKKSGAELLGKILSKYPQAAYQFEVGKPAIVGTEPDSGMAKVRIPVVMTWDKAFLAELKEVVRKVAMHELTSHDLLKYGPYDNKGAYFCFASRSHLRNTRTDFCSVLDKPSAGKPFYHDQIPSKYKLLFSFKDRSGSEVGLETYYFSGSNSDKMEKQGIRWKQGNDRLGTFISKLDSSSNFNPPNMLGGNSSRALLVTDGKYTLDAELKMDVQILKDIVKVDVSMSPLE
jgi:hypothetical protein